MALNVNVGDEVTYRDAFDTEHLATVIKVKGEGDKTVFTIKMQTQDWEVEVKGKDITTASDEDKEKIKLEEEEQRKKEEDEAELRRTRFERLIVVKTGKAIHMRIAAVALDKLVSMTVNIRFNNLNPNLVF